MKKRYLVGAVAVIAAGLIAVSALNGPGQGQSASSARAEESSPITAKGTVQPARQSKLSFRTSGQIVTLLTSGEQVAAGQELAKLDTAELDLAIAQAEDAVAINQALLAQAEAPARAEDLAQAQAAYEGALAKHNQLLAGTMKADLASAEGAVASARAALAEAQQRQAALDPTSSQRATEIRNAELALEQAKNTLWATQIDRDGVKGNAAYPDYMRFSGDAKVAAAETAVTQAQATLDSKRAGATEAERKSAAEAVASAQVALTAAETKLDQLKRGATPGDKESSAAQVAQAKAALDMKRSGAASTDVAVLKARLKQSQTALEQAKVARRAAMITAPFAGSVIWSAGNVGDTVAAGAPVVAIADLSQLEVETSDLDEGSAAKIAVGQPVKVFVNAFTGKVIEGTVKAMAPLATTTASGDANFTATIALNQQDASLRLGMTTKVDFGVSR